MFSLQMPKNKSFLGAIWSKSRLRVHRDVASPPPPRRTGEERGSNLSNYSINSLRIHDFVYLLSAYADDTTFFVSDLDSVKAILVTFDNFSINLNCVP